MLSAREMSFASNVEGALQRGARRTAWVTLLLLCALVAAAFVWASRAVLEEVTSGLGRVVPAQQLQVAQSLEGGIVRELLVREGRRVFLMAPIHHHFEALGWPESKVIVRFWIAGLVMALFALTTLKFR